MARKEKLTLEYFPHYTYQGDITNIIQEMFGNDGYAVLHKTYEQMGQRDRQYIDLSDYKILSVVAAYCKVSKEKYLEIVKELVALGAYDKELWEEKRILASESFIENTKDAYKKRVGEIPDFQKLKNFLLRKSTSKCISGGGNSKNDEKSVQSGGGNQQIKEKEIKEKKNTPPISPAENLEGEEGSSSFSSEEILNSIPAEEKFDPVEAGIQAALKDLEEEKGRGSPEIE